MRSSPLRQLRQKSHNGCWCGYFPYPVNGNDHVTGWEIAGSGALRKGRYKITYVPLPRGPQWWELFDIVEDPGETQDLSKEKPEIFNDLLRLWAVYAGEVGVVGLAGQMTANNRVKPQPVENRE